MTTYIPYMYRDSNNYKQHACIMLTAPLTGEQTATIIGCLDEGLYFIPEQVGAESLQHLFGGIDVEADHPWHELGDGDAIEQVGFPMGEAYGPFTPEEFTASFVAAKEEGWKWEQFDPVAPVRE